MCLYSLPVIQNTEQPPVWVNSPTPPAIRPITEAQRQQNKIYCIFPGQVLAKAKLNSLVSCSRHYGILYIILMWELNEKEPFFGLDLRLERFDVALPFSRTELPLGRKTPLKSDLLQVEQNLACHSS